MRHPMLDPAFFANRLFSLGAVTITLVFFGMVGMFFVITQYFQFAQGHTPLDAGFRNVPLAVTMMILAPRCPAIAQRIGGARHDERRSAAHRGRLRHHGRAHAGLALLLDHGHRAGHDGDRPGPVHAAVDAHHRDVAAAAQGRRGIGGQTTPRGRWARRSASPCWERC